MARSEEKVVYVVRHPSLEWLKVPGEGKSTPAINKKGIGMMGEFRRYLTKEKLTGSPFSIYTSSTVQSRRFASVVQRGSLNALGPFEHDSLKEVPFDEADAFRKEAKEKKIPPMLLWSQKDPEAVVQRFNEELPRIRESLNVLADSKTGFNLAFTHRVTAALLLWAVQENKAKVSAEDLPGIMDLVEKITDTSFSKLRHKNGKWTLESVGETPHLARAN